MQENVKTYQSRLSVSLVVFLFLIFSFVGIGISFNSIQQNEIGIVVCILTILFIIYMYLSTIYKIINNEELVVKVGFLMNIKIDIKKIVEIKKTKSMISSPAWSLNRIEIFYNKYDSVIISPKNQTEFIQDLQKINSSIKIDL
ncbi:PH domain-containing protein [Empedobacter falsenii]|uniref:PH domain-containing protein n=2 Tax=Empedobacter TaxID=59734 RepID=A0ABY8V8V3_9FLAO|nr:MULTISPECIES: PH domain-containing protein [Empedobacter]MCA4777777.1 PH domain-containing protein [Empedobacter stercoris]MCA4783175.1 PH domain-containing protein [Empedobacter stercoris]MCA4810459.1 PH domain-containing protein [Empedobacter stercoris]NOJ74484.1 PH domain-containing protein [Empedobacter stercoris]QNT14927.1 PH domain-containing protein [Empedobacter stercoris]